MLKANADKSYPSYGCAVDMWACGVVFYTLIAGRAPFYNRRVVYMLREIKDGRYSFPSSEWEEVSFECKDLVSRGGCPHSVTFLFTSMGLYFICELWHQL